MSSTEKTLSLSSVKETDREMLIKKRSISEEQPNKHFQASDGIGNVVASHYNQLEEKGLDVRKESRIVYLRNFHNWIKSVLIDKFLCQIQDGFYRKIIALDLCCGKGGDLQKWRKGRIHHLICADIAATSVAQCQERYGSQRENIFSAEFLVADCTKTRLKLHLKKPETAVDIVSCQFSFHYSFESLPQAEMMIKNASEVLCKDGIFVGTIPNAEHIMSLLEASGGNSFGNEVFKIEFPEDRPTPPPLFGDKYNFFLEGVVNCPEFLVHFPTLVRICKKYDLELIYNETFSDVYKESIKTRKYLPLLFRMRALELFPAPPSAKQSSSAEEEYVHVEKFLKERGLNKAKTLSKSEWETTCIYQAFAFKKLT